MNNKEFGWVEIVIISIGIGMLMISLSPIVLPEDHIMIPHCAFVHSK